MAFGLPDRHDDRTLYSCHEALDSGKPALADDPRFRQGSRRGRARDSSAFSGAKNARTRAERPRVRLRMRSHTPLAEVARALFKMYRRRTLVGLLLMAAQAFFYNAVFFTYALILTNFYGIPAGQIGWYILPFAAGNVLGSDRARPPVRHNRPQSDDRGHLRHLGHLACGHRIFVQPEPAVARNRSPPPG